MRLQLAEAMAVGRRSTSQDLVYSRWRSGVTLKRLSLRRPLASGLGAGPVVLRLPLALLAMIPNGMEVDEGVGRGGRVKVLRVRLLRARLL
jgi:hypothetical protein